MHWIHLGLAIVAEVAATSALKSCDGFTRLGPSLIVIAGYTAAFYCLSLSLRIVPVGTAYAIWSGLGLVLIVLAGRVFFGQQIDLPAVMGFALIIGGIMILSLFSQAAPH